MFIRNIRDPDSTPGLGNIFRNNFTGFKIYIIKNGKIINISDELS